MALKKKSKRRPAPMSAGPFVGPIESGREVPKRVKRVRYPFGGMKPSDNFLTKNIPRNRLTAAISNYSRNHGGVFYTAIDREAGGIRVFKDRD